MELTSIKNELIIYKNNNKLKGDTVKLIQDTLLTEKKEANFKDLLNKVKKELDILG